MTTEKQTTPQTAVKDSSNNSSTQMTTFEKQSMVGKTVDGGLKLDFATQLAHWEDEPLKKLTKEKPDEISVVEDQEVVDDLDAEIEALCAKAQVSFKQSFQHDILALESTCKSDQSYSKALKLYQSMNKDELMLPAISSLLEVLVTFETEMNQWSSLIILGTSRLESETECQQTRFFEAALKAAVFSSSCTTKTEELMPEHLIEMLILSIKKTRPEMQTISDNFKSLEKKFNKGKAKKSSAQSQNGNSASSQKQHGRDSFRLGSVKMTAEQASFNQRIEELFKVNQHEKAWQVFTEMSKSDNKPNVATYQLLFKNVRKNSGIKTGESTSLNHYLQDDLERVIQLFFQLNASQRQRVPF